MNEISGDREQNMLALTDQTKKQKPRLSFDDIQDIALKQQDFQKITLAESSAEKKILLDMLDKGIVGQDEACSRIAEVIDIGLSKVIHTKGPLGILFFAGPTGVGKSEAGKVLAEGLLGSASAITRIDCETLQEEHSSRILFGAPPSYVGYSDPSPIGAESLHGDFEVSKELNRLHSIIEERDGFSIVIFEEIEKAHPKIRQSLLGILEEGTCTLANGDVVYYGNTLFIFTSNVGEAEIENSQQKESMGFTSNSKTSKMRDEKAVFDSAFKSMFSPEFRGRIGEPIRFNHLNEDKCNLIIKKKIEAFNNLVQEFFPGWNLHIGLSDECVDHIISCGYNKEMGARDLMRNFVIIAAIRFTFSGRITVRLFTKNSICLIASQC